MINWFKKWFKQAERINELERQLYFANKLNQRELDKLGELNEIFNAKYKKVGKPRDHTVDVAKKVIEFLEAEAKFWRYRTLVLKEENIKAKIDKNIIDKRV